jgi:DNA-directed RNA polymerase I subunit RPA2
MLRKLYAMVAGSTCPDNPDSPQHHEVLLPGFLYGMIIKERFDECLNGVKAQIGQDVRQGKDVNFSTGKSYFGNNAQSLMGRTILCQDRHQSEL